MTGLAVMTLDRASGRQLAGGQDYVAIEEDGATYPVVLLGDPVAGHGNDLHGSPIMAEASDWISIDGVGVCRAGHAASCGHETTGRPWMVVD